MDNCTKCRRITVKIGSSTLTHSSTGRLNIRRMESLCRTLSDIKNSGREVVLVSSGAVAAGSSKLGLPVKKRTLSEKQALAAVGQTELMRMYERLFAGYGYNVGQVLMTKDVVDNLHRLELARNTFSTLFSLGCIPIVNENDSISSEELQFGGNDTLSAYVSVICNSDLLVNLSDIDGLYNSDPRKNPDAQLISRVERIDEHILACAGGAGTEFGTGGMTTKLKAAQFVCSAGIPMLILNGKNPEVLYSIIDGKKIGTYFCPDSKAKTERKKNHE